MQPHAYIAATRFGLGARPDEWARIQASPMDWLVAQLQATSPASPYFAGLPTAQQNAQALIAARQQAKLTGDKGMVKDARHDLRKIYINEISAKVFQAVTTTAPFYERLVDFWSNHFTVSIQKNALVGLAGAFEREAIRPHVLGKFSDLLMASTQHPAMLIYLDNFQSIGPGSPAGQRSGKGLNENLAREIMELHTLGVNGGYSQSDVTSFAKILTGWGIGDAHFGQEGAFYFAANRHEPGEQTVMGKRYADVGQQQGMAVLQDFAHHPATAMHTATQLAQHFIADEPPAAAVQALAATFSQTGGDLSAMYRALLARPEVWALTTPKIKNSYDLLISAVRVCGAGPADPLWYLQSLKFLGDVPLTANSPAGFSDHARDIAGPEAIMRRIEWAKGAANKLMPSLGFPALVEMAIGPILNASTRAALAQATDSKEGLALLLGSPEFQRR